MNCANQCNQNRTRATADRRVEDAEREHGARDSKRRAVFARNVRVLDAKQDERHRHEIVCPSALNEHKRSRNRAGGDAQVASPPSSSRLKIVVKSVAYCPRSRVTSADRKPTRLDSCHPRRAVTIRARQERRKMPSSARSAWLTVETCNAHLASAKITRPPANMMQSLK